MGYYVLFTILMILIAPAKQQSTASAVLVDHPDNMSRQRNIEFFQHIIRVNGTYPASEVPLAGAGGPEPGAFGYSVVFDHKLTQGSDYYSPEVGRARGAGFVASMDGSVAHETFTVTLSGRNGDISLVGAFNLHQPVSRIPVVGASGEFFRVEGIYTSQVVASDGANVIARVTLTLRSAD